jgi:hypothetical protein
VNECLELGELLPLEPDADYMNRLCEERSDAAIHEAVNSLDCRASLAMTKMMQIFSAML